MNGSSDTAKRAGTFSNVNKNLFIFENDHLHHLLLNKSQHDFKNMFGDVKFACLGGQPSRMLKFAKYVQKLLNFEMPIGQDLKDITREGDRYSLYKVGPVIFANHGIGCPSLSVLLNEIMKLLVYAQCKDVTFFRVGTCGGIGVQPGTVVITEEALDGLLRPEYRQYVLGKEVIRSTSCDRELIEDLIKISNEHKVKYNFEVVSGKTLCAFDFYEAQARSDGIFCDYTEDEKKQFLLKCQENQIKNIEMESLCFSGYLKHAGAKFAIVCVTLLDRLETDQITTPHKTLLEYQERPFEIVGTYIKDKILHSL